jgi:hypothetical protein
MPTFSGVDPDSKGSLDPDPEGKKDPQKKENKVNKFNFLK